MECNLKAISHSTMSVEDGIPSYVELEYTIPLKRYYKRGTLYLLLHYVLVSKSKEASYRFVTTKKV